MSVIATSVIILFALIFLGFFLGKGGVIRQESIPDLSNLVIWVTLPVTVFCSIVDERGAVSFSVGMQMVLFAIVFHALAFGITFLFVKLLRVPDKDKGVWLFTGMLTNGGFIGLPLAQAVFGSEGVFIFAVGNILTHLLIFSVGLKLLTWHYPTKQKINVRKMLLNNINIAVVLGLVFAVLYPGAGCFGSAARLSRQHHKWDVHAGSGAVSVQNGDKRGVLGSENVFSAGDSSAHHPVGCDRADPRASHFCQAGGPGRHCPAVRSACGVDSVDDHRAVRHQHRCGEPRRVFDNAFQCGDDSVAHDACDIEIIVAVEVLIK